MVKCKVVFTPSGKRGEFEIGTNLLDAARSLGVDLDSVCGGRGICGRCQVIPSEGEFSKFGISVDAFNLGQWSATETAYEEKKGKMKDGRRLGCCATIEGDLVVDIPEDSQVHKQVVRKEITEVEMEIDPVVGLFFVAVDEADMNNPIGDLERLIIAVKEQHGEDIKDYDGEVLRTLQNTLRKNDWKVTAVVRENQLIAVWAGQKVDAYGFAIDLGSTTISCNLVNLITGDVLASVGAMNPQIRFGEDLMSRVSYAMMNKGGDGEMTSVVRDTLSNLFNDAVSIVNSTIDVDKIDPEEVVEIVVVGNPVMHHLFLGLSPVELGWSPFTLATSGSVTRRANDLSLTGVNNLARIYILPCVAGHVGADAAAVVLATRPDKSEKRHLIIDIGTNAEIIYGDKTKLFACSSPTGPALEGAQIACGQRAAPGAIERVRINPETLEPRFSVIGSDLWSDEEGFDKSVKQFGVTGICGSGIIEVLGEMYLSGIISFDGIIDGDLSPKSNRIVPNGRVFDYILHYGEQKIKVTQGDVRAIQLAKGALWAGCKLMEDKYGDKVEQITLAGAFGSHIDTKYAMILGLIPDCDLSQVSSAGNAAGTGARMALLSKSARVEIEELVKNIEKIETAVESDFQEYFVDAMAIPNKTDEYINLQKEVSLPPKKIKSSSAGESGGRRRRR